MSCKNGSVPGSMSPQPPPELKLAMAPENIKPLVENAKGVHVRLVECIAEIRVGEPTFSPVGLERTLIVQYTFLFLSFQCSEFTKCYGRWSRCLDSLFGVLSPLWYIPIAVITIAEM